MTKKPNIAVSSPELVQARKVRLVTRPSRAKAARMGLHESRRGPSGIRQIMSAPSSTVSQAKISEIQLQLSGGAISVVRQIRSSNASHRKLVYPSTGANGGGFHTYP